MNKKYIIVGLSILLATLIILFSFGIGSSYNESLASEELTAYHNRHEYTSLNTPAEKASYALGMTQMSLNKYLDGLDEQSLATFYSIISQPRLQHYYWGQTYPMPYPLNFNTWGTGVDLPLDLDYFTAGLIQTINKNVVIPDLSGEKGAIYLNKIVEQSNTK